MGQLRQCEGSAAHRRARKRVSPRRFFGLTLSLVLGLTLGLTIGVARLKAGEVELPVTGVAPNDTAALTALASWSNLEAGRAPDRAVIVLHGTMAHRGMETVSGIQAILRERGIASLAPTLTLGEDRRTGMKDCNTVHNHRHEDAVTELLAWAKWLRGRGVKEIVVAGHSRGGAQVALAADALKAAAEAEEAPALKGLVMLAPMVFDEVPEALAPALTVAEGQISAGEPAAILSDTAFLHCEATRATAAAVVSYYSEEPVKNAATIAASLEIPFAVIAGSADEIIPDLPTRFEGIAEVQVIDGADHFFLDLYAEEIVDVIEELLAAE